MNLLTAFLSRPSKALVTLTALVLASSQFVRGETFYKRTLLEGVGRGSAVLAFPTIYQSDRGLKVQWTVSAGPGGTYVDLEVVRNMETSLPTIAVTSIAEIANFESKDLDTPVYIEANNSGTAPLTLFEGSFDYSRNGAWVESMFIGETYVGAYPWIFQKEFGWLYVNQAEPALFGMAFWLYNADAGWSYVLEAEQGWIWSDRDQAWSKMESFPPADPNDPQPDFTPVSPPPTPSTEDIALTLPPHDPANPGKRKLQLGERLDLQVAASIPDITRYKWYRNGELIADQATPDYSIDAVTEEDIGDYHVELESASQTLSTGVSTFSIPELIPPQDLINISTRGYVATGNGSLIAGFVVEGDAPQTFLVRGVGPELSVYAPELEGETLANPRLTLTRNGNPIATNRNWFTDMKAEKIQAALKVGAFPLAEESNSAAILIELNPGIYTAVVEPDSSLPGIALVEVYRVESVEY